MVRAITLLFALEDSLSIHLQSVEEGDQLENGEEGQLQNEGESLDIGE